METDRVSELYADISACLGALVNALDAKGVLSKAEAAEAFQERLLSVHPSGKPTQANPFRYLLLNSLATGGLQGPNESLEYQGHR